MSRDFKHMGLVLAGLLLVALTGTSFSCRDRTKAMIAEISRLRNGGKRHFYFMKVSTELIYSKGKSPVQEGTTWFYQGETESYMKNKEQEMLVSGGKSYYVLHEAKQILVRTWDPTSDQLRHYNDRLKSLQEVMIDSARTISCYDEKGRIRIEVVPSKGMSEAQGVARVELYLDAKHILREQRLFFSKGAIKYQKILFDDVNPTYKAGKAGLYGLLFPGGKIREDLRTYKLSDQS